MNRDEGSYTLNHTYDRFLATSQEQEPGQEPPEKELNNFFCRSTAVVPLKKGKVFPYSLPSVGPGADPGVQAVSPQVT